MEQLYASCNLFDFGYNGTCSAKPPVRAVRSKEGKDPRLHYNKEEEFV